MGKTMTGTSAVALCTGDYRAPTALLVVGSFGANPFVRVVVDRTETEWQFAPDGRFKNFSVARYEENAMPVEEDGGVMCCEHVRPGYHGLLFTKSGNRVPVYLCAACVQERGFHLDGCKIVAMPKELFGPLVLHHCSVVCL